ncbi:MAG: two-component regulator propeller domain-containing protein [Niabella sp.]
MLRQLYTMIFLWGIGLGPFLLNAQNTGNFSFRQLSVNEGLSHSDVTIMVQDVSGFLWLGTHNGLNKYDGQRVQVYKNDPAVANSLPDNRISVLYPDGLGRLWIGTERNGLCYYNEKMETFINVPLLSLQQSQNANWVSGICSKRGKLLVATKFGGLFMLDISGVKAKATDQILFEAGDRSVLTINAIINGSGPLLWVATNKGLYTYHTESRVFAKVPAINNDQSINKLLLDKNGSVWVGRRDGLFRLDGWSQLGQPILKPVDIPKPIEQVESLFQDKNGIIWVGTLKSGVYRLIPPFSLLNNKERWVVEHILKGTDNTGFVGTIINSKCFFEDKYGMLWVGTAGGGAVYTNLKNNVFQFFTTTPRGGKPLADDAYISTIYAEPGRLWLGTRKGLCIYMPATKSAITYLSNKTISYVCKDRSGTYWISCGGNNEGLWKISGATAGLPSAPVLYEFNAPGAVNLTALVEDHLQRLWVGTYANGIYLLSKDRKKTIHLERQNDSVSLASNQVNYLYQDPYYPIVWVSYKNAGIDRIEYSEDGSLKVTHFSHNPANPRSLSSNFAWAVRRTKDSALWVATLGGGLNKMIEMNGRSAFFVHYTMRNGLKDNDIESMEEDASGNLWLAGYGLTRFNPVTGGIRFFDYTDGLQSNAFKVGASFKDQYGNLYFGGINGMNYFDPLSVACEDIPPDLAFTDLRVYNKTVRVQDKLASRVLLPQSINFSDKIQLSSSLNDFTIDFIGIHFAYSSKMKYRYKLEGYNKDWVETDFPSVSFANLPPGIYELSVYAMTGNQGTETLRKMTIQILPPWWATGWAYTLYLLLAIYIVYMAVYIIRRENRLKRNLLLAAKEKELHQGKLEFFTNISHELRTPMTLIYGPLTEFLEKGLHTQNAREKLWQMYRNTKRLLLLTNQLLDFRKMETGNVQLTVERTEFIRFLKEIYLVFKNKALGSNISYEFQAPETLFMYCDRSKMEIVFTNLLSNAFKYTASGGRISVKVAMWSPAKTVARKQKKEGERLADDYLEVTVEDDGIGIAPEAIKHIFDSYYQATQLNSLHTAGTGLGLSIAKDIVHRHHGFIEVESTPKKGTRFLVRLPLGARHFTDLELVAGERSPDAVSSYELLPENLTEPAKEEIFPADDYTETSVLNVQKEERANEIKQERYRLLIIEDNAELLLYLKKELGRYYKVAAAENGKQGLEKARQWLPDIILSDVMMPEMDGLELCVNLKADPDLNHIPVILLTARSASVYEIESIETGADDYITKPFNFRLLRAKINRFLTGRQQIREYYRKLISLEVTTPDSNTADEQFLSLLIDQVEQLLGDSTFNVRKLCQSMAMSQSTLYKRIKDMTGASIVDFVRSVRIKKAAQLLLPGKTKINEVAAEVGISDLKYFREQFRKHFGQSPSEYLKNKGVRKEL